ncbi:hypothetical protein ACH4E8_17355 [Streptomyces sp. NPDC017979]|uniref:hypothetical protein n=1 Tax=Streptomyces sp. NPDC017979 TaxID=3365024 RepID=UPI003798FAC7
MPVHQEPADPIDPAEVLGRTPWSALEHAYGPADDVPEMLLGLLDTDQSVRSQALSRLHHAVHHQNTLYSATAPAALYVVSILSDTRTLSLVDKGPHGFPGPMRAELLGWLDSVANEADDEAAATSRHFGFPPEEYPPFVAICRIRSRVFHGVCAYLDDSDVHVRAAAISACIPLLDDPHLLHHRATLVPLLREVLATSGLWQYRARAIEALASWGEDTTGMEDGQQQYTFRDAEHGPQPWAVAELRGGCDTDPPF